MTLGATVLLPLHLKILWIVRQQKEWRITCFLCWVKDSNLGMDGF